MKPTCKHCKKPFLKAHRWTRIHRSFLWVKWSYRVHHNCLHPEMGPSKRLKGEMELPFPDPMIEQG